MNNLDKIAKGKVVKVQGGEHATYDGLLDLAHKEGLVSLECRLVQAPDAGNEYTAICEAQAVFRKGELVMTFGDIGDANPKNTNKVIALHIIRMASTRAKGRVLRDALNIDGCTADELMEYAPNIHEEGAPAAGKKAAGKEPDPEEKRDIIRTAAIRAGVTRARIIELLKGKELDPDPAKLAAKPFGNLLNWLEQQPEADADAKAAAEASFQPKKEAA